MVDFDLSVHKKQGTVYLKKEIRETLGHKLKAWLNLKAGVIYPEGTPPEVVLESLKIIQRSFEQQIKFEKEGDQTS